MKILIEWFKSLKYYRVLRLLKTFFFKEFITISFINN